MKRRNLKSGKSFILGNNGEMAESGLLHLPAKEDIAVRLWCESSNLSFSAKYFRK